MTKKNASIIERMELAQVVDYLSEAKKLQEAWVRPSSDMIT